VNEREASVQLSAFLDVDLGDDEGVGHLVAADNGYQANLVQENSGRSSDEPHRHFLDVDVFVVDLSASDDLELLVLGHGGAHMDEEGLLVEESAQGSGLAL